MKRKNISFVVAITLLIMAGCATAGGYKPDPSIPAENLAVLRIADSAVHVTAIDGIETPLNYPKSIKIQEGKHTITCYHQRAKEIVTEMARALGGSGSLFDYFTKIEFEFSGGHVYEVYDSTETSTTGTLQEKTFAVAIREGTQR